MTIITLLRIAALLIAALYTWAFRFTITPDGFSYLEVGDAFINGEWNIAVNAYWSTLYSWVLGITNHLINPGPYWEVVLARVLHLVIFIMSMICFEFFMRESIRYMKESSGQWSVLDDKHFYVVGYMLFMISAFHLDSIKLLTADLLMSSLAYLICAMLIRIRRQPGSAVTLFLFGVVCGLGYLTRHFMLYISSICVIMAIILSGSRRRVRAATLTLTPFLAISLVFIFSLYTLRGRHAFNDAGRLNYAVYVNGVSFFKDVLHGKVEGLSHPVTRISSDPFTIKSDDYFQSTYPLSIDPTHSWEGIKPRPNLREQIKAYLNLSLRSHYELFFKISGAVTMAIILFALISASHKTSPIKNLINNWFMLLPPIGVFGGFAILYASSRFFSGWHAILLIAILSAVRIPAKDTYKKLSSHILMAASIMLGAILLFRSGREFYRERSSEHTQWKIAKGLAEAGLTEGERIALVFNDYYGPGEYWLRLAGVRTTAECFESDRLWQLEKGERIAYYKKLGDSGVDKLVSRDIPKAIKDDGWINAPGTTYWIYKPQ